MYSNSITSQAWDGYKVLAALLEQLQPSQPLVPRSWLFCIGNLYMLVTVHEIYFLASLQDMRRIWLSIE